MAGDIRGIDRNAAANRSPAVSPTGLGTAKKEPYRSYVTGVYKGAAGCPRLPLQGWSCGQPQAKVQAGSSRSRWNPSQGPCRRRHELGREPINLEQPADVRFGADNGLKSDMAPCPKKERTSKREPMELRRQEPTGRARQVAATAQIKSSTRIITETFNYRRNFNLVPFSRHWGIECQHHRGFDRCPSRSGRSFCNCIQCRRHGRDRRVRFLIQAVTGREPVRFVI